VPERSARRERRSCGNSLAGASPAPCRGEQPPCRAESPFRDAVARAGSLRCRRSDCMLRIMPSGPKNGWCLASMAATPRATRA